MGKDKKDKHKKEKDRDKDQKRKRDREDESKHAEKARKLVSSFCLIRIGYPVRLVSSAANNSQRKSFQQLLDCTCNDCRDATAGQEA